MSRWILSPAYQLASQKNETLWPTEQDLLYEWNVWIDKKWKFKKWISL